MKSKNQEKLLDAMMLLEVADKMYPQVEHLFVKYTISELICSAHDLIQHVYSSGETNIEANTREMVATLEAARRYIDCGGHLYNPSVDAKEGLKQIDKQSSVLQRILARIGR